MLKKQAKKAFLGSFWEILTKKLRLFGARSTLKLVYIGAEVAFRKILGSVSQKRISQNSTKRGPFGSALGPIPEGKEGVRQTHPPKSAPDQYNRKRAESETQQG